MTQFIALIVTLFSISISAEEEKVKKFDIKELGDNECVLINLKTNKKILAFDYPTEEEPIRFIPTYEFPKLYDREESAQRFEDGEYFGIGIHPSSLYDDRDQFVNSVAMFYKSEGPEKESDTNLEVHRYPKREPASKPQTFKLENKWEHEDFSVKLICKVSN